MQQSNYFNDMVKLYNDGKLPSPLNQICINKITIWDLCSRVTAKNLAGERFRSTDLIDENENTITTCEL